MSQEIEQFLKKSQRKRLTNVKVRRRRGFVHCIWQSVWHFVTFPKVTMSFCWIFSYSRFLSPDTYFLKVFKQVGKCHKNVKNVYKKTICKYSKVAYTNNLKIEYLEIFCKYSNSQMSSREFEFSGFYWNETTTKGITILCPDQLSHACTSFQHQLWENTRRFN